MISVRYVACKYGRPGVAPDTLVFIYSTVSSRARIK